MTRTSLLSQLTDDEREFLQHHDIKPDELFDGRGMTKADRNAGAIMEELPFLLAETCTKGLGHRLISISGHCIQCRTIVIRKVRDESQKGQVYIAASKLGRIYKIGHGLDAMERGKKLCSDAYGGFADWQVIAWAGTNSIGRAERAIHDKLKSYSFHATYLKVGKSYDATELFKTSLVRVWQAFNDVTKPDSSQKRWKHLGFIHFEFE